MKRLQDEAAFFNILRKGPLLGPVLDQNEVTGTKAIVEACGSANWGIGYTAYALATAYHETAGTMKPIKELGGASYLTQNYDVKGKNPKRAIAHGNTKPGDGIKYCGRGYVQLTWKNNYAKAEEKIPIPGLVNNPDLAMVPENAAKIMISGMSEGWFTGRACKHYLHPTDVCTVDAFTKARSIINGTDKAQKIASHAIHFQDALLAGKWA